MRKYIYNKDFGISKNDIIPNFKEATDGT